MADLEALARATDEQAIGNLQAGARAELDAKLEVMTDLGIIEPGEELNMFQLAVAVATAYKKELN